MGAITTVKDEFCVVIEYCEYGSLDSFLRNKIERNKFVNELVSGTDSEGYVSNMNNSSIMVCPSIFLINLTDYISKLIWYADSSNIQSYIQNKM
jgi:hypothetical protein